MRCRVQSPAESAGNPAGTEELRSAPVTRRTPLLVVASVASLAAALVAIAAPPPADAPKAAVAATAGDVGWPMFNQTYDAQRYSSLGQITASNVSGMKEVCRVRV